MKKIFLTITALIISFIICLGAVGCSSITYLSFNNNFDGSSGGGINHLNLKETLTYSVTYTDNYNEQIKKDSDITDDVVKFNFDKGTYVQTLEVLSSAKDIEEKTDIDCSQSNIYYLHTELSIKVNYQIEGKEPYEHLDTIITDCYFLSSGQSLSPLYSKVTVDNSYLLVYSSETPAQIIQGKYEFTTVYQQKNYKLTSIVTSDEGKDTTEKTYNYNYKTAIDNAQLLFALRNVEIEEKATLTLPVVSPSYGKAMTLQIKNAESSTVEKNIIYSDGTKESTATSTPVKNYNFMIHATENTGALHYMKYQKSQTENLPFRSLLIEYAAPIICFSAHNCIGALVYQLDSVEVSQSK